MSHAPGPWNWSETDELSEEDDLQNVQFLEAEANARLIAAAPDLLEALYNMVGLMSPFMTDDPQTFCLREAQAAIAKATGGFFASRG